jgi:hypothetical protein
MGKRKLHNETYYQCDWTGFPMRSSNCYWPKWNDGKLQKLGSYCNWESVLAHACDVYKEQPEELAKIKEHIKERVGGVHIEEAPHYCELEHFAGGDNSYTAAQFHNACCYRTDEVLAVKISADGFYKELLLDTEDGKLDYKRHIKPAEMHNIEPQCFQILRKGKKDKELCLFYHPGKFGTMNALASNLFKMQIHGDVLLLQCSKEASFMPRERFVHYSLEEFKETYMKKRKKYMEVQPMDSKEYAKVKAEMQVSLSDYEQQCASQAQTPQNLGKLQKIDKGDGRQMARLVDPVH